MAGEFHVVYLIDGRPTCAVVHADTVQRCEELAYMRMADEIENWVARYIAANHKKPAVEEFKRDNWSVWIFATRREALLAEEALRGVEKARVAIKGAYKEMGISTCRVCGTVPVEEDVGICRRCEEKKNELQRLQGA